MINYRGSVQQNLICCLTLIIKKILERIKLKQNYLIISIELIGQNKILFVRALETIFTN